MIRVITEVLVSPASPISNAERPSGALPPELRSTELLK